jgi:hypothetical protein
MDDPKHAVVILAPEVTPEGRGRILHAFYTARDLAQQGVTVEIYLDGIGVTILTAFAEPDNTFTTNYTPLFNEIRPLIRGTCDFCSRKRFDASAGAEALGVPFKGGDGEHHTLAPLIQDGYQVHTF